MAHERRAPAVRCWFGPKLEPELPITVIMSRAMGAFDAPCVVRFELRAASRGRTLPAAAGEKSAAHLSIPFDSAQLPRTVRRFGQLRAYLFISDADASACVCANRKQANACSSTTLRARCVRCLQIGAHLSSSSDGRHANSNHSLRKRMHLPVGPETGEL